MTQAENQAVIKRARDILVGKVPMPMEQCHEITKALIYKFISVSDQESEADGDAPFYFCGAAKEYRWDALMSMRLPADSIAGRYRDGLAQIGGRRDIPQAFQGIYQDAGLPCDDAPTVAAFLRAVDAFDTANTETIGDAFEHLLQDTGAQGKAGQFRTPRHIIDFIVDIVNPQSRETILDPACGTGGFLTAAWRHIQRQEGDSLTIPDRNRVAGRLAGYDLAPDMVKLASVNLFLQHNQEPRVEVYDTVSHDGHWNDHYDVILANPPFMSPAGIIKPHSRFYTRAKRTEVLFVDYIASHLNPRGRAGVIVPEGIIFQSQNAYKQLRKLLVEEYLAAVVSLPAGVFQPYSGVKTSILILDKELGRQGDTVGFFKVEQDGFDLGAQRRPAERDDLPRVRAELGEYLRRLRDGESLAGFAPQTGLVVEKSRLAAGGEYNLSGERYRESGRPAGKWPLVALGEVAEVVAGQSPPGDSYNRAGIGAPFYQGKAEFGAVFLGEPVKWTTEPHRFAEAGDILMSVRAPVGPVNLTKDKVCIGRGLAAIRPKADCLMTPYAFHILRSLEEKITGSAGATFASINKGEIEKIQIPLPPLSVQGELVAEVEGYEAVIAGARQVVASWRPRVEVRGEWAVVELGECCVVNPKKSELAGVDGATRVSFVPMADMVENAMYFAAKDHKQLKEVGSSYTYFRDNDVLVARVTPCFENGKAGIARGLTNGIGFGSSEFHVLRPTDKAIPEWIYLCVATPEFQAYAIPKMTGTGGLQRVPRDVVERYKIPLPPLSVQGELVAGIEEERVRVEAAGELAGLVGGRLRGAVGRVWGC